jgi:hypothetical protein
MDEIQNFLIETNEFTGNQIIDALSIVGKNGDIMLIKNDGVRSANNYTVVISSGDNKFDSIRYDSSSLNEAMKKALKDYI